jgi:hypothetical protein
VIRRNGETVAYVGSMDIAAGRLDTREHDLDDWWKLEPPFPQGFYGFTGGMLYIKGQAVLDIARHLFDQITDPVDPFYCMAPYYRDIFEVFEPCGLVGQNGCMHAPTLGEASARARRAQSRTARRRAFACVSCR